MFLIARPVVQERLEACRQAEIDKCADLPIALIAGWDRRRYMRRRAGVGFGAKRRMLA